MLCDRRSWRYCLVSAALALVLQASPLPAQSPTQSSAPSQPTGSIAGSIIDPTGAVIPNATITATLAGSASPAPITTTSNGQGSFTLAAVPPGVYIVEARSPGFRLARLQHVTVQAGKAQRITLTLPLEVQQQQVTVNANQLDSSPDKNGDAIILKGSDLEALPDDPDELTEQLQAIAGSDPDIGTQFYIDGFSGGRLPPKSAIREIRMNQNPFSAQYDQVGFGRIEIFTKPGADTWHADLFSEINDSSFNSRNPFVTTQPPYHSLQLWGDLNGPVTKHSSQFTELWRESSSDDSIVNAFVLDSSLTPAPFTQVFPKSSADTDFSTRYDWELGKIQTLSLSYHLSLEDQTNAGVGQFALASQAYDSKNTEQVLRFSDSQTYGAKLLNETRFQYIRDRNRQTPQTFGPTIVVQGGFTGGGSNLGFNNDAQDHYELQNYVQTSRGKHTIDFGVRFRALRDSNDSNSNFNGQYTFASLTAYQITEQGIQNGWTPAQIAAAGGGPSLFSQTTGKSAIAVSVLDTGLYAEDNYKLKPNLTVSYGLRFESQTQIPDHADFAPRFAASWALNRGKNKPPLAVLRAGYGLFYQRFPSSNVLEAERQNGVTEQDQVINDPSFYPATCSTNPTACSSATTLAPAVFRISPTLRTPYIQMARAGV
ncbi:MAG: carboxypeptidase regulatory-like domain-containing protein, partial [Acidobacteriaceae bacterium]